MNDISQLKAKDLKKVREDLLKKQKGKCAICGDIDAAWQLDHCHETGLIRGVLCRTCNTYEGKSVRQRYAPRAHMSWTDPITFLSNIVKYWKKKKHPMYHPTFNVELGKQKPKSRRRTKRIKK